VGPPHKQRYMRYSPAAANGAAANGAAANGAAANGAAANGAATVGAPCVPAAEAGRRLAEVKRDLFEGGAFGRLLRAFTTVDMLGHAGEVRRMRPGAQGLASQRKWQG
jgi:hypothetical protein